MVTATKKIKARKLKSTAKPAPTTIQAAQFSKTLRWRAQTMYPAKAKITISEAKKNTTALPVHTMPFLSGALGGKKPFL
jgi:hypothetical protein